MDSSWHLVLRARLRFDRLRLEACSETFARFFTRTRWLGCLFELFGDLFGRSFGASSTLFEVVFGVVGVGVVISA